MPCLSLANSRQEATKVGSTPLSASFFSGIIISSWSLSYLLDLWPNFILVVVFLCCLGVKGGLAWNRQVTASSLDQWYGHHILFAFRHSRFEIRHYSPLLIAWFEVSHLVPFNLRLFMLKMEFKKATLSVERWNKTMSRRYLAECLVHRQHVIDDGSYNHEGLLKPCTQICWLPIMWLLFP